MSPSDPIDSVRSRLAVRPTRYDLVLTVIPAAFAVSWLLAGLLPVPRRAGVIAASIVGAIALVDALFLNPPGGRELRRSRGA